MGPSRPCELEASMVNIENSKRSCVPTDTFICPLICPLICLVVLQDAERNASMEYAAGPIKNRKYLALLALPNHTWRD